VEFGTGLKWEEVYTAIEQYGISVLGGRITGVGVGGVTLGGGKSAKELFFSFSVWRKFPTVRL
jgi:hypothetical protein